MYVVVGQPLYMDPRGAKAFIPNRGKRNIDTVEDPLVIALIEDSALSIDSSTSDVF